MVLVLKIVILALAGIISYSSTLLGLFLLLLSSCTFTIIMDLSSIIFSNGSIDIRDIVIFVLFIKTVKESLGDSDRQFKTCVTMIGWLSFCSLLTVFFDQAGFREAYRIIFKIALFWILPITVRELSPSQKKTLVFFSVVVASVVSIIQLYALMTMNLDLISLLYPKDPSDAYGYADPGQYFADIYNAGVMPRLYIPGHLFVRMIFGFTICFLAVRPTTKNFRVLLPVAFLTGLFTLALGGRSDFLFIVAVIILSASISSRIRSETGIAKKMVLFGLTVFSMIAAVVLIEQWADQPIITQVTERWLSRGFEDEGVRLADNIEAISYLLKSPLWGIGVSKIHWDATFLTFGGQDVHPVISQGLIGGLPGIVLLLCFVFILYRVFRLRLRSGNYPADYYAIAAVPPLAGAFLLSAINTSPVFLYSSVQVPLGIFSGLLFFRKEPAV